MEYARGISKPLNGRNNNHEAINLENYTEDESGMEPDYQSDYSYHYNNNTNFAELDANHHNFASEIDKIKAMFN